MKLPTAGQRGALGNYASMRLLRDNQLAWSAAIFALALLLDLHGAARRVALHGTAALYAPHSLILTPIWMLSFFLPAMLQFHYWRQVRTNIGPGVPGLLAAEFRAVCVVLAATVLLLASPLIWLGAPVAGALALACLGIASGGAAGAAAPSGQSRSVSRLRGLLLMPLLLIGLVPHLLVRLLYAPLPVVAAVCGVCATLVVTGLQFRPAAAAIQLEQQDTLRELFSTRRAGPNTQGSPRWTGRLRALLLWKPGGPSHDPAAAMLSLAMGPIGVLLQVLLQFVATAVLLIGIGVATGDPLHVAIADQGPFALAVGAASSLASRMQWLQQRSEWPLLMVAGRFGARRNFAAALFRTHRNSLLQLAIFSAIAATGLGLMIGLLTRADAPLAAALVAALVFGGGYTASMPLLWRELGGRGLTVACGTLGYMGVLFTLALGVFHHRIETPAIAAAIAAAAFGTAMAVIAPRRLATLDWPLEEPVVPA